MPTAAHVERHVARSQGDPGVFQIARAMKTNTNDKLVELDLGYNEIKDDGAVSLAQVCCLLRAL